MAAIEKRIYEPVLLPKGQMGNGIAACRGELTVNGQTKEVWLSRSENLDRPPSRFVTFADSAYEIIYDVDVIRSKVPAATLRYDDVDNRLLEMSLCSACASNAWSFLSDDSVAFRIVTLATR